MAKPMPNTRLSTDRPMKLGAIGQQHDTGRADQQAGNDDLLAAHPVGYAAHQRLGEDDADQLHAEDDADLPRRDAERGGEQGEEGFDGAEYQVLRRLDSAYQHDAAVAQHGGRGWSRRAGVPASLWAQGSSSPSSKPAPSASTPLMAQAMYTALKLASEIRKPPRNGAIERPTMVTEE